MKGSLFVPERKELVQFLQEMSYGFLGTVDPQGWPYVVPVNFVFHENKVYFHGSQQGCKRENFLRNPQVSFTVAKEYAYIPSYWSDPHKACPAGVLFKSVLIRGHGVLLEAGDIEKIQALNLLMEKLQPEGGYERITTVDPDYEKIVNCTEVFRINVEEMTGKFKFAQHRSDENADALIKHLEERDKSMDRESAEGIKHYRNRG